MLIANAWLHNIDPFAWRISGDFGVRWYGLAYILGFLVAWQTLRVLAKRRLTPLRPEQVTDLIFAAAFGVFLGGRLGYILIYQPSLLWTFETAAPWWGALAIHKGGMSSHGGIMGVVLACFLYAPRARASAIHLLDLFALVVPVGLFFGRIANFVNGELLGRVAAPPGEPAPWWSVKYPHEILDAQRHMFSLTPRQQEVYVDLLNRVALPGDNHDASLRRVVREVQRGGADIANDLAPLLSARYPSQLIQAFFEGVVLLAALWLIWVRPRRPGVVGAWFLILYGVGRIFTETVRLPDAHLKTPRPAGLTYGQWLSVGLIAVGAALLTWVFVTRGRSKPVGGWLYPARADDTPERTHVAV